MLGILGIHLLALVIFGSWTVYQAVMPKDPTFDEPPPMEKIERVQLEYKVRMQEKQKQSQRPKQKLQVKQISQMNMPEVDIQVPNINSNSAIGRLGNGNFGNLGDGGGLSLGEVSGYDPKTSVTSTTRTSVTLYNGDYAMERNRTDDRKRTFCNPRPDRALHENGTVRRLWNKPKDWAQVSAPLQERRTGRLEGTQSPPEKQP